MGIKAVIHKRYPALLMLLIAGFSTNASFASSQEVLVKPSFLGLTDAGWVALAMALFAFIAWRAGAFRTLTNNLDSQIAKIKSQLDDAERLRQEALELKLSYEKRQSEAEALAANIVAQAEQEAARMIEAAQEEVKLLTIRRTRAVEARIEAAERAAISELRTLATQLGANAAAKLLQTSVPDATKGQLVDQAIAELEQRLH
jgi:F-type H+-transporting ATPase subunit b